jgi:hypothetical protein
MSVRWGLAAVLVAVGAAGCGALPPQAPSSEENRVASALAGIAAACGESYQQRALPSLPARRQPPIASAGERAGELLHVAQRNPRWIYQGHTLAEVVALAAERLRECGLGAAARVLAGHSG